MKTIENQINKNMAISYIEGQIFRVMPYRADSKYQKQIMIKLHSEHGESNWLNISPEDCNEIEAILINSYLKMGK